MPQGRVVIDRWLDDVCPRTSDLRTDAGHRWIVREVHTGSAPLPRGAVVAVPGMYPLGAQVVQERAEATAEWAAGRRRSAQLGTALAPVWVWWLWALGLVDLAVADALAVVEYATDRVPALAA
ncbi:hypothetical protein [Nocardiopsis changdeensis]|uniref:hypothetical protein n=1 Tax=Nocardiopsis changdeensis TaxID=2831969 RepID=UPI003F445BF3